MSGQKSGDRQCGHGFSGTGFPYQSDDLPCVHMEADLMHNRFRHQVIMKFDIQILNVKHRLTPFPDPLILLRAEKIPAPA